jgi:hypothetical protein
MALLPEMFFSVHKSNEFQSVFIKNQIITYFKYVDRNLIMRNSNNTSLSDLNKLEVNINIDRDCNIASLISQHEICNIECIVTVVRVRLL